MVVSGALVLAVAVVVVRVVMLIVSEAVEVAAHAG